MARIDLAGGAGTSYPLAMMDRMADPDTFAPDAPACPLLGLALDPRTHYTFPHPAHRCHAEGAPAAVESRLQSTTCLSALFTGCGRFRAWERRTAGRTPSAGG